LWRNASHWANASQFIGPSWQYAPHEKWKNPEWTGGPTQLLWSGLFRACAGRTPKRGSPCASMSRSVIGLWLMCSFGRIFISAVGFFFNIFYLKVFFLIFNGFIAIFFI
jgi:hypothetical protein